MLNHTPDQQDVQLKSKWCSRCTSWKTVDQFYRNRAAKDGLQSYCKPCFNAYLKEPTRAVKRAEFGKEYNQRPEVIEVRQARQKEYHKKEQTQRRHKAAMVINTATRNGTLPHISEQVCQACGEPAEHYHHWAGYDQKHWLHVIPVCQPCHKEVDANVKRDLIKD